MPVGAVTGQVSVPELRTKETRDNKVRWREGRAGRGEEAVEEEEEEEDNDEEEEEDGLGVGEVAGEREEEEEEEERMLRLLL